MSEFKEIPDIDTVPGNAKELSDLMESDPLLEQEILYLSGGVESYKDRNQRTNFPITLSLEDSNSTLVKVIERILRYLQNMIKDVFDGSAASAVVLSKVHSRAEELATNSRFARRNSQKTEFEIATRIQNLSVKYKPISDPQVLLQHLKVFNNIIGDVYRYLTVTVYGCFEDLIKYDPLNGSIEGLAASVVNSSPAQLMNTGRFINQGLQLTSPQLLGNQKIVVTNKRPDGSPLDKLLACNMTLENAELEPREIPNSIKYNRFGISLEQSLIREVISVIQTLGQYNNLNRRSIRRQRMQLVVDRIAAIQKIADEVDTVTSQNVHNYIRMLEVYSGWMMSPYVGMIALTHRNLTAVLNVCEGNTK